MPKPETTRANNPFAPFTPSILNDILRPAILSTIENHTGNISSFNDLHDKFLTDHYTEDQTVSKTKFKEWLDALDIHVNRSVDIHIPSTTE